MRHRWFSTWSLTKLRDHLLAEGIVAQSSRETLRRILRAGGVSHARGAGPGRRQTVLPDPGHRAGGHPTYGSNWIEAEFAALRYFALNGTDHRSHSEQNAAIAGYVRWHNTRAQPKVNFATDSPIRTWTDYPAKAA